MDISKLDSEPQSLDWALWFYWIMATTSGWVIGNLFFGGIPIIISGVLIAAMQWAVLYKRIEKAWQWFVYSSLGWIAGIIIWVVILPGADLLAGPLLGGLMGMIQWSILRRNFNWSGWWVVISMMAWTTGLTLMPGLLTTGTLPGAMTGITLVIFFRYSNARQEMEK